MSISLQAAALVDETIAQYPPAVRSYYQGDRHRLAHDVSLAQRFTKGSLVDLGAGFSPFGLAMRRSGWEVAVVDQFDYGVDTAHGVPSDEILAMFTAKGVSVQRCDIQNTSLPFATASFDGATCFAVLEHFHRAPRAFLKEVYRVVRPGGWFVTSCPNSVNLRKRFSVISGKTNLPSVQSFWHDGDPTWHGHVREPTLSELAWMATEAGFRVEATFGRNFLAQQSYGAAGRLLDPLLRMVPGFCSDIYVVARR